MKKSEYVEIVSDRVGLFGKGEIVSTKQWEDDDLQRLLDLGSVVPSDHGPTPASQAGTGVEMPGEFLPDAVKTSAAKASEDK